MICLTQDNTCLYIIQLDHYARHYQIRSLSLNKLLKHIFLRMKKEFREFRLRNFALLHNYTSSKNNKGCFCKFTLVFCHKNMCKRLLLCK